MRLPSLSTGRTMFVRMDDTGPTLPEDAPDRRVLEESGMEVAMDSLEVQV